MHDPGRVVDKQILDLPSMTTGRKMSNKPPLSGYEFIKELYKRNYSPQQHTKY